MSIKKLTANVEVVQTLSTYPNQEDDLSPEELKAKFDEGAKVIKDFINEEIVPAINEIQEKAPSGGSDNAVLFTPQELTEEQKAQARKNIGADEYVTPQRFGAVGDGVHDDTDAIRAARDAAIAEKKALFFPAGTYLVHGCIELWSDCEIYGEGSRTVIKKTPAYFEEIKPIGVTENYTAGQTTFKVADGSKYTVGYDFYMGLAFENTEGMCGRIESIDGNNVTVSTYPKWPNAGDGVLETGFPSHLTVFCSHPNGKTVFSTSFPVFCSHRRKADGSWNVLHNVHIHDLTIDGNRQDQEAKAYPLSAIHFDPLEYEPSATSRVVAEPNTNIRIENLNVYNSPADGISIQSCKNVSITNCITENCAYNGVHFGVGTENGSVVGCKLNANYCGFFDCVGVNSVSLSNNHFENCPTGIGGLDRMTRGLTVTGNTFRGCGVGVKAGATKNTDANVEQLPSQVYAGIPNTGITISNNTFYGNGLTGVGISFTQGHYFTVNGNTFRDLARAMEMGDTSHVYVSNNIIKDCAVALAMGTDDGTGEMTTVETTDSAFVNNVIHAEAEGTSAAVTIAHAANMRISGNIVTGTNAGISVDEATTTGIVEGDELMANINNKLDTLLASVNSGFQCVSGEFEVAEDDNPGSVVYRTYEVAGCPAGAKLVVLRADQTIIDRILAEHSAGTLDSGYYLVGARAAFNYSPVFELDNPANIAVYQRFISDGVQNLKGVMASVPATNSPCFSFDYISMLKGKYYWTAYYWDEGDAIPVWTGGSY